MAKALQALQALQSMHDHREQFFYPNFFVCLKTPQKNSEPTISPSRRKVSEAEEERKRKNAVNSGHLVP